MAFKFVNGTIYEQPYFINTFYTFNLMFWGLENMNLDATAGASHAITAVDCSALH